MLDDCLIFKVIIMSSHPYHKYEEILHNMTQISEINKCLNEILNEERTIEANLSGLMNKKSDIQDEMSKLTKNAIDVQNKHKFNLKSKK